MYSCTVGEAAWCDLASSSDLSLNQTTSFHAVQLYVYDSSMYTLHLSPRTRTRKRDVNSYCTCGGRVKIYHVASVAQRVAQVRQKLRPSVNDTSKEDALSRGDGSAADGAWCAHEPLGTVLAGAAVVARPHDHTDLRGAHAVQRCECGGIAH